MDQCVGPCNNFYLYACGGFLSNAVIPPRKGGVGSLYDLLTSNEQFMKELLTKPVSRNQPNSFEKKMKDFYKRCVDTATVDKDGVRQYTQAHKDSWPTMNSAWEESSFDLQALFEYHEKNFDNVLFQLKLFPDNRLDDSKYMLEIAQPTFPIPQGLLANGPRQMFKLYEKYYTQIAVALGGDKTRATADAIKFIDFMIELAKICLSKTEGSNFTLIYNPTTTRQMNTDLDYADWNSLLREIFKQMKIDINLDQRVNVKSLTYFQKLGPLLKRTEKRVVQNYFGFFHALRMHEDMTSQMSAFHNAFLMGVGQPTSSRTSQCVGFVDKMYNVGMAKLMSETRFSTRDKSFVNTLIQNVKSAFERKMLAITWMSEATKTEAIAKVKAMAYKFGVPDQSFGYDDIDQLYAKHSVGADFIGDLLRHRKLLKMMKLKYLNQPFKPERWDTSMTAVDAFYSAPSNVMTYGMGMLQEPFFNPSAPGFFNYGSFGYFIAHEISHSFSMLGSYFDHGLAMRNWWSPEDTKAFAQRTQCYVQQYNKFRVDEINKTVNGELTMTENTADNLALSLAYDAYQQYLKDNPESPPSHIGRTNEQMLFISMAQPWCVKKILGATNRQMIDKHSPFRYRVIGPLQNSHEFAKAFDCDRYAYMNPANKCDMF